MADKLIHEWYLEHCNAAENKNKFYEIMIWERGGKFYIARRYGRIGNNTKAKEIAEFEQFLSAEVKAQELVSAKQFSRKDRYTPVRNIRHNEPNVLTKSAKPQPKKPSKPAAPRKAEVSETDFWSGMVLA
ncbi:TPA: WGR domain-containing protein [Vibrio parahaemolyticus]|uniref:WGR domain-containing protein n=1 Tax=Vibrio campbellii TaxID=680 RepID=UPI001F085BD0|nr:WGR domain-containing protein [Vibrio campbellii]UMM06677.1 WGR domain-containing protein [Vibrio campbellii]